MSVKIRTDALKKVCSPVLESELSEIIPTITGMTDIANGKKCIGLAANQVGLRKRVIVINCTGFIQTIINPVIVKTWGGMHGLEEGCLSYPGKLIRVVRPRRIRVTGVDENWQPVSFAPKGLIARAILHEVDHLNGITMFMRAADLRLKYQEAA